MEIFLPVTTFLNCHRFKLLLRRQKQIWGNFFFIFHCSSPVASTLYSPLPSCASGSLHLSNPWTNSYNHLGSPTPSHHNFPAWLGKLFTVFPTAFLPFQQFPHSNPSLPMTTTRAVVDLGPEHRTHPLNHFDVLSCGPLNISYVRPAALFADMHYCWWYSHLLE